MRWKVTDTQTGFPNRRSSWEIRTSRWLLWGSFLWEILARTTFGNDFISTCGKAWIIISNLADKCRMRQCARQYGSSIERKTKKFRLKRKTKHRGGGGVEKTTPTSCGVLVLMGNLIYICALQSSASEPGTLHLCIPSWGNRLRARSWSQR